MASAPLRILLTTDDATTAPWPPERLAEALTELGHDVDVDGAADREGAHDIVHLLGDGTAEEAGATIVVSPAVGREDAVSSWPDADRVVVRSSGARTRANQAGVPMFRIGVVPVGVDCGVFTRHGDMARRTGRVRLVAPADGAGLTTALQATALRPDLELLVVAADADGGQQVGSALSGLAEVRDRVAVVEAADAARRAWFLRSADAAVAVDPDESHADFVAESMACGTPVVATPVEEQRDLVVHGITGFHVAPQSPLSTARAVRRIVADAFSVDAFAMAASDRATSRLDWSRVARDLETEYRRALAQTADDAEDDQPDGADGADEDAPDDAAGAGAGAADPSPIRSRTAFEASAPG